MLSHPDSGGTVRVFDIPGGTQANLSIQQSSVTDFELVPAGDRTLVATGSILYGASDPDFLSLKPLLGGPDTVLVIDTGTKQVVTQIPVGSHPRTVRMQGDVGPHER